MPNSQQHQHDAHGDARERVAIARQAAEMLFTPKKHVIDQPVPAEPSSRKPRILRALPPTSVRHEQVEELAGSQQPMTSEIPNSHIARIRTWVKYGMTTTQAAAVYGVAVGVIERILRQI